MGSCLMYGDLVLRDEKHSGDGLHNDVNVFRITVCTLEIGSDGKCYMCCTTITNKIFF